MRHLPGIKKVFIRSGIRYDYLMAGKYREFLADLCEHHVSGQLKVAPEHVAGPVLAAMQKSGKDVFLKFLAAYRRENQRLGKEQYLVPYLMCSHPGSSLPETSRSQPFCLPYPANILGLENGFQPVTTVFMISLIL